MPRKMKESGVEWLGQIPEGWEVCRVKDSFAYQKGLNITKADLVDRGIFVISYGQIHSKTNTGTYIGDGLLRFVPESFLESNAECLLKKNDFVFADTSEDLDGLGNCAFCDRDDVIFAGYHTIVLRPTQTQEWKYCAYLFKTDAWRSQFRSLAFGIKVFSLSQRLLNVCTFVLPPLPEQQRIAAFLDERCAKIDGMIAEAKASIEDYKKWKQSIIFEAVTGKHEKNLKPSGIDWIGDVPEGWRMEVVKHLFSIVRGRVIAATEVKGDGYPVYSSQTKNNGVMGYLDTYDFERDQLTWTTDGANAGAVFLRTGKYSCTNVCGMLSPKSADVNLSFVCYALGYVAFYNRRADINGYKIMSNEMAEIRFPYPPVIDQRRIAAELDEKCAAIDKFVGEKEALIADLKAYKKSLIFETVTGKREIA